MENELIIGQYILGREIGRGGMAEVWEARHAHLGNRVAIKFLSARYAGDSELETRFLNEGQRQAQLHHPNLVSATDFLQIDGRSYLVMRFIDGENLEQTISAKNGPLDLEQVHTISWDILSVLDYAHTQGVVHRDVKPSNILIENTGRVYLTDFGIALVLTDDRRITHAEMSIGTPDYMSPEQILSPRAVDSRADIYSFGCVLYAMLTGGPPFGVEGATEFYIKDCHVRNAPPPMHELNPNLSSEIESVVLKCLEKDPANRFQSCSEVMRALDAAIATGHAGPVQTVAAQAVQNSQGRRGRTVEQAALVREGARSSTSVETPAPVIPPVFQPELPPFSDRKRTSKRLPLLALLAVGVAAASLGYAYYFVWPETVLRMEGSTTVGLALGPALVRAYLANEGGTDISQVDGQGSEKNQFKISARVPGKARRQLYLVVANGSGNAFKALGAGTAQIGMSSRPINDKEYSELSGMSDFRSFACENVIALDGIAIIVNRENPVQSLTRAQIAAIFKGWVPDWSIVGGRRGPIHLLSRDTDSGTFDSFVAMVMSGDKNALAPSSAKKPNGEDIADAVAGDPNAIGFVGLAQIGNARPLAVSDGGGTASLLPNAFTVGTEDYILSRRLFFYVPSNASKAAEKFVRFAVGEEAQQIVKKTGYVPLEATLETVRVPDDSPTDYRSLSVGKRRMHLDFRFRPDSKELDTKSLADVSRAASILTNGGKVYLLGFADSQGLPKKNLDLSLERAQVVAEQFKQQGIKAESHGLSSEMPVGNNNTVEGREKNRRVEVWVL